MSEISTSSSTTVLTPGEQQVVDELGNACKTNNGYSAWTTFRALFQRRHLSPKLGRVKPEDERHAFIFFFEAFRVGPRGGHDAEVAKEFNKLLLKLMERYQCDPLSNEGRVVLLQMDALYGSGSHESEPSSSALLDLLNLTHQYHRMGSGCASPRMIYPDYIVPPLPSQEMRVDNFRRLACWRGAQLDLYELLIEYMHQAIVASGCRDPEEKLAESSEASLWMSRAYHCAYQHVRQMQTLIQVYMREEAAESEVAELFAALNASVMMVIHWSSCGHQAIQQVEEASRLIFNSHLANFSECEWILAMYVYEVLAGRILALRQPTVGGISLTEERVVLRQQLAHPPSLMETSPVLRLGAFRTTFDAIRAAQAILRVSEAILAGEESRRWPTFLRAYLALISSNSVGTSSSSLRSDPARNAYGSVVAALCQPNQLLLQELPNLKWELLAVELS